MITDKTEISATIDWLQYTSSNVLFPEHWQLKFIDSESGMFGYTHRRVFPDGRIVLWNSERPEMSTHVIMNGGTLDNIERLYGDAPETILAFLGDGARISRIDLAVDAMRGCLDIDRLRDDLEHEKAVTMARCAHRFKAVRVRGDTLYVGAASSTMRLRIYDKAAEQNVDDFEWTRVELQARKPKANPVAVELAANGYAPGAWIALIRGFCDFPEDNDWVRMMNYPGMKIRSPLRDTSNTRKWLLEVCAPALARYQGTHPGELILDEFLNAYRKIAGNIERRL